MTLVGCAPLPTCGICNDMDHPDQSDQTDHSDNSYKRRRFLSVDLDTQKVVERCLDDGKVLGEFLPASGIPATGVFLAGGSDPPTVVVVNNTRCECDAGAAHVFEFDPGHPHGCTLKRTLRLPERTDMYCGVDWRGTVASVVHEGMGYIMLWSQDLVTGDVVSCALHYFDSDDVTADSVLALSTGWLVSCGGKVWYLRDDPSLDCATAAHCIWQEYASEPYVWYRHMVQTSATTVLVSVVNAARARTETQQVLALPDVVLQDTMSPLRLVWITAVVMMVWLYGCN